MSVILFIVIVGVLMGLVEWGGKPTKTRKKRK